VRVSTDLVILTADELIALDVEGRGALRRSARETPTALRILRAFLDGGGPVPVGSLGADPDTLVHLHDTDLIRVDGDSIDLAYPFSSGRTPFIVRLSDGRERYACCATDALGFAPMIGETVSVSSRCQHSGDLLTLTVSPDGPEAGAAGIMVWSGEREARSCRSIDSL
jgi:hypothetical protein